MFFENEFNQKVQNHGFLHEGWTPGFGSIFSWLAMDKNGKLSLMINNCWGDIPKIILAKQNVEEILGELNDFLNEESNIYNSYPKNKEGDFILDFFSSLYTQRDGNSRETLVKYLQRDLLERKNISDANVVVNKGIFIYEAVEGNAEGEDYPIGYEGTTVMGDYYRHLMPTIYATIDDFPKELWHGIAVSKTLDFTKDRLIFSKDINKHFIDFVRV